MGRIIKWQNVQINMSTNEGGWTNKTISAITKATEAVCSSTAHGFTAGQYVWLTVEEGMWQLNDRIARIKSVTDDTFTLEKIDTTLFDTAEANKSYAKVITFPSVITTATSVSGGAGGFEFLDATTIHKSVRVQVPGLAEAVSYTFDNLWDPDDAGLIALKAASDAQDQRAFKFQFGAGGRIMVFLGYVGASLLPSGTAQQLVTTQCAITMTGSPSYYGS